MKIAIIGAGAMGGLFGARLMLGAADVSLIEACEATIETIQKNGLQLVTPQATYRVNPPIGKAKDFRGFFDLIVVFTKGFHTLAAIESVRHLVGPQTWALSVQNGLGNAELIAEVIPAERIIVGMTNFPADLHGPGVVHSQGEGHVKLWAFTGAPNPTVDDIAWVFDTAGLNCEADPQVHVAIWEKVAFNAALNSICAVTGLTVGALGDSELGREWANRVVAETAATAIANGVAVEVPRVTEALLHAFANHHNHKPSMLQDREAGRRTEIEFINGAVVAKAKTAGVATPTLEMLRALVLLSEGRAKR